MVEDGCCGGVCLDEVWCSAGVKGGKRRVEAWVGFPPIDLPPLLLGCVPFASVVAHFCCSPLAAAHDDRLSLRW